jgi:hypothetical protein
VDGLNTPPRICHGADAGQTLRVSLMVGVDNEQSSVVERLRIADSLACFKNTLHFLCPDLFAGR